MLDTDQGAAVRLKLLGMTPEERAKIGVEEPVDEYYGPWVREGVTFYYPDKGNWFQDCYDFATQEAGKYKLVVVDTTTHLGEGMLNEVKNMQYQGIAKATKRVHLKSGNVTTVHPTQSDYGFAQDRVMEFVKALDGSGAHVLLLAHEKLGETKDTENRKRIVGGPRTVGNALLEILPSVCDVVLRVEVQGMGSNTKLCFRTINHNFFIAGDRSGLFKDGEVVNPKSFWTKLSGFVALSKDDGEPSE